MAVSNGGSFSFISFKRGFGLKSSFKNDRKMEGHEPLKILWAIIIPSKPGRIKSPFSQSINQGIFNGSHRFFFSFLCLFLLFRDRVVFFIWLRFNLILGIVGFLFGGGPIENRHR